VLQKILNIGVSDLNNEVLNRKIRISNLIALLSIIILTSFVPLSVYLKSALSIYLLIFFTAASFLNFYLHTKRMHIQAFYTYTISGFIYFIFSTLAFGLISNLQYFMLVMCMISVVIFDRTAVVKGFIALAIICFFSLRWFMSDKEGYLHLPAEMAIIQETVGHIIMFLIFIITSIFFIFFKSDNLAFQKKILHQKEIIEEKNKDITASITYAKRLQEAILPPKSIIESYLPDSFILFKPKDIVAGDFYWMETSSEQKILFAAADCTGHGVPGAMVSVVCSNALNRAVKEFGISEPGKILDKVKELVVETFQKSESEVRDGMDISLLSIDKATNKLEWAGANNPLLILRNKELIEFKPDKQPIGKVDITIPFKTHQFTLAKGDLLYTFTDGFADQFGGPKGKKFKYAQLKELLVSIHSLPMPEQLLKINSEIEVWRGNLEQVDDILLAGIRI
jgi:serine phosphatase RsbU (regulator of sigma subunit)